MPRSTRSRRFGGLALAGAVAAATVVFTAPAASAVGYDGTAEAEVDFDTSNDGSTGNCVFTSGSGTPLTQTLPFTSNGVPVSANISSTATVQDDGEPADTTNLAASVQASASATEVAGGIKTFDMRSTTSATVSPAQGTASNCDSSSTATWTVQGTVIVTSPSIRVLKVDARGGVVQVVLVEGTSLGSGFATATANVETTDRERRVVRVEPGTYTLAAISGSQLNSPQAAGDPTTRSAVITAHAEFFAPGTATGKRTGTGKKYMKLPGSLDCVNDRVVADFTNKAGKKATAANGLDPVIRSAAFFVNGEKVKTKRKPHKNTKVKLKNLDTTDEVEVEAVLKLWDGHKVTVTRGYLPCD